MGVVIAIIGGILKWILWILLGLLGLLLLLLLVVLLTPLRYRVQGEKGKDGAEADIRVSFLLHLVSFHMHYREGNLTWKARLGPKILAAYPAVEKPDRKQKRKPAAEPEAASECPEPVIPKEAKPPQAEMTKPPVPDEPAPAERSSGSASSAAGPQPASPEEEPRTASAPPKKRGWRQKATQLCWRIRHMAEMVIHPFRKAIEALRRMGGKLQDGKRRWEEWKALWEGFPQKAETARALQRLAAGLIRPVFPRKYHGSVCFGFEDPARTAQVLGYYYMLWPLLFPKEKRGCRLEVKADFENPGIEVRGRCRGHFSAGSFLLPVLKALANPHIRRLIRYILKANKKHSV